MSVYGEFDDRFRPRPSKWRLAVLGLCHLALAAWIANALLSAVEMSILRKSGLTGAWIVEATPWDTIRARLSLTTLQGPTDFSLGPQVAPEDEPLIERAMKAGGEMLRLSAYVALGFVAFAVVLALFWPTKQSLATRLFVMTLAQMTAMLGAFGALWAEALYPTNLWYALPMGGKLAPLAALIAMYVCGSTERRINELLANIWDLQRPWPRVVTWCVRLVPGLAAIGVASWYAGNKYGAYACVCMALVTLLVNLASKPRERYEQLAEPEMREAAATTPVVLALLLAAAIWAFGFVPQPRTFVLEMGKGPRLMAWSVIKRTVPRWWPRDQLKP